MNTEAQGSGRGLETIKWIVVAASLLITIVGSYLYHDVMLSPCALAVVILIVAAGGITLSVTKGGATVAFAREACTKVRKVTWPTHQETLYITLAAAVATAVVSLILQGLDGTLARLVSFITGLGF